MKRNFGFTITRKDGSLVLYGDVDASDRNAAAKLIEASFAAEPESINVYSSLEVARRRALGASA